MGWLQDPRAAGAPRALATFPDRSSLELVQVVRSDIGRPVSPGAPPGPFSLDSVRPREENSHVVIDMGRLEGISLSAAGGRHHPRNRASADGVVR